MSPFAVGVLGLALSLFVVACGDDGAETVTEIRTQTSAAPLTKTEYIAQADALCTDINSKSDPLGEKANAAVDRGDYEAAADLEQEALDAVRPTIDELNALPKPTGDEAALEELEQARSQIVVLIERLIDALRAEDLDRVTSLSDETNMVTERARGIAIGYGFKVCGQD